METVWEIVFKELKEHFDVYPPATKKGECTKRYAVLKKSGTNRVTGLSSKQSYYEVLLYVPRNKYHELEKFKVEVEKVISENLFPMLMPTGYEQPDFFDDEVKAHMTSIQYRNNVRDKHL